jgi:hypothetical protein
MFYEKDPYGHQPDELRPLQIQAMQERLAERQHQIPVLARRVRDTGVEAITDFSDAVPLLFAHTVYKSYPDSFVAEGRWDQMCRWLGTLSTVEPHGIDMSHVTNLDEWVACLSDHNHYVACSSGTSGKASFLHYSAWERDAFVDDFVRVIRWTTGVEALSDRPVFLLGPRRGPQRMVPFLNGVAKAVGRPDATYWLTDEPITIGEMNELGRLARAMATGKATPGEVAESERLAADRQERMRARLESLIDAVLDHRHEPSIFCGAVSQFLMIMEMIQARGLADLKFHPDTLLVGGGGLKGLSAPDNFQELLIEFFGIDHSHFVRGYSMSELGTGVFPTCSAARYHCPPWIVLLILDRTGERLLNPSSGEVNGRVGLFDITAQGRWGGVISGDNVDAQFSRCPCGRPGPTVRNIVRYVDLDEGDDKLTCAGTLNGYVRGILTETEAIDGASPLSTDRPTQSTAAAFDSSAVR